MKDRPGCALKNKESKLYMNELYDAGVVSGDAADDTVEAIDCYVENRNL